MTTRAPRATAVAAVWVALLSLSAACAPSEQERSIGLRSDEVVSVEYFEYPWAAVPDTLERLTIVEPDAIEQWVRAYTDMPISAVGEVAKADIVDAQAQASRFTLENGDTVELTAIWVAPHDVIVIWPDGTASRTAWGSPDLFRASADAGSVDIVDAGERPTGALPE